MPDMLAGRLDYICEPVQTALPLIGQKTVNAIATLTRERVAVLPDLPTAHEQGLADLDASLWFALFFPKGTADAIVRRLNGALSDALDSPGVRERLESIGLRVVTPERRSPDYLARLVASGPLGAPPHLTRASKLSSRPTISASETRRQSVRRSSMSAVRMA
jgi:putative tricarboxylic transport membrane protein